MDDDSLVRRVFAAQLEEAGHAVLAAGSGAAALLVSDLSMPGMDGLELIRKAQARRPGLPAILITGHPVEAATSPGEGARGSAFQLMHKPVSGTYLAERIATMPVV